MRRAALGRKSVDEATAWGSRSVRSRAPSVAVRAAGLRSHHEVVGMKFTRLYCDTAGSSRLEDVEVAFASADFAPPGPPVDVASAVPGLLTYSFAPMPAGSTQRTPRRLVSS